MDRDDEGMTWLEEIIDRLEQDPAEYGPAIEGLSALDEAAREHVIVALSAYHERPGVRALFRFLGMVADSTPETSPAILSPSARVPRSLITAVDGEGRGTIVISASDGRSRRTAAFRCDVRRGILDAVGEVEEEHESAGRMVDEGIERTEGHHAVDRPELAVRLLQGCLLLSGPEVSETIRSWLEATIGPASLPPGLSATLPGPELDAIPDRELSRCAELILDACPAWLDRSSLTIELGREIALREGSPDPDPVRDAGAYRYLFEHLLIGRLDLYSRMLLWMAWVWHAGGHHDLSQPAFAMAAQLSDDQYAVPSHPFTVALTTRSLRAAQAALRNGDVSRAGE